MDDPGQGPPFVVELVVRLGFHQRSHAGLVEAGEAEPFDARQAEQLGHQVDQVGVMSRGCPGR